MKPTRIKELQARSKHLLVRVIDPVAPGEPYVLIVNSGTRTTLNRVVTVKFERNGSITARCTCKWAEHGGVACTHVIAALNKLAERKNRALSFWLSQEDAHRQKHGVFKLRGERADDQVWITSRRPNGRQQLPSTPMLQANA
ncbi:MAG: SWIM zinc finger family protein [Anaerolineae bacterium]|nr:SWIM zinc finger family protein [Anaerolineae bacterium]